MSSQSFDGISDILKFFFYYENVAKRSQIDAGKASYLLGNLKGAALGFYFDKSSDNEVLPE